jgi:hypothetical protein
MKRDNLSRLPAPAIIFSGNLGRTSDASQESRWPHGPLDLKLPEIIGKIKEAVLELDAGNVLADIDRFFGGSFCNPHALPSLGPLKPEQGGIGTNPENKRKPLTLINCRFRRTAESLRRAVSVTSDCGTGAAG